MQSKKKIKSRYSRFANLHQRRNKLIYVIVEIPIKSPFSCKIEVFKEQCIKFNRLGDICLAYAIHHSDGN